MEWEVTKQAVEHGEDLPGALPFTSKRHSEKGGGHEVLDGDGLWQNDVKINRESRRKQLERFLDSHPGTDGQRLSVVGRLGVVDARRADCVVVGGRGAERGSGTGQWGVFSAGGRRLRRGDGRGKRPRWRKAALAEVTGA